MDSVMTKQTIQIVIMMVEIAVVIALMSTIVWNVPALVELLGMEFQTYWLEIAFVMMKQTFSNATSMEVTVAQTLK